jgi:acetoacetate decarboxylase
MVLLVSFVCFFIVLHDLTIFIGHSWSATEAALGVPVAIRPVEGVYTHNSFVPDHPSARRASVLPGTLPRSVASWQFMDCHSAG